MFDDINKSKIGFDEYVELKKKTLVRSFTEKFKWVDKFLYLFSWFGNAVSIFLAYFFMQKLLFSSIKTQDNIFFVIGIIIFLTMYELLKRYVFSLFSTEFIKEKYHVFTVNMIPFIFGTLILISGSFYLSLNGAKEYIDNQHTFTQQTETIITNNTDSINNFYFTEYIKPLNEENKILTTQNNDYSAQTTYKSRYLSLIAANNKKIEKNNLKISQYEQRRDNDITQLKQKENEGLSKNIDANKSNMINFILLSTIIELIIMIGIYFDKFFKFRIIKEYEDTIVNTSAFKKWHKFNFILEILYSKGKDIDDQIPSVNDILELTTSANLKLTKPDLDKFIKILYYLEIIRLDGKRRYINVREEEAKKLLKNYFNIK
jgi:hypothetical protein